MRNAICCLLLIAAGCAGQPRQPTTPPTRYISNAPVVEPVTATGGGDTDMAKVLADAKRRGYTLVNENGETLFCHKTVKTGSHLVTETTCLTEREMYELRTQTQQVLQSTQLASPPPQGK